MINRFNQLPTLKIKSGEQIPFTYKGKKRYGVEGDTIATALYANGVRIYSRSLKYHRPRGFYAMDGECANTMMEVNGIPNVLTETTLLKPDMDIKEQNVKGSAEKDLMGFMDKMDWAMPAGFYYDVMHKPAAVWPVAMKQIRKAAGIGTLAPDYVMPGEYDEIYPTCDVCVIGGGPAGMMAALAAAEKDTRVILMEARPWLGGNFDYRSAAYNAGQTYNERATELAAQVDAADNIRVFTHTANVGVYNNNLVTGFQVGKENDVFTERYVEIRATSVVVATGCIERCLLFDNNERPGVMQAGTALRIANTFGMLPGNTAVFSIGHDFGLEVAVSLFDLGLEIPVIADVREDGQNPALCQQLADRKITLLKGWVAAEAIGKKQVNAVMLASVDGTVKKEFDCDVLVASAGFTPLTGPLVVNQAKLKYDAHTNFFLPTQIPEKMYAAGRLLGYENGQSIEVSGKIAGYAATGDTAKAHAAKAELEHLPGPARGTKFINAPVKGRKSFICFDEDTTVKNIKQAIDKGFDVPELIKRFSGAGLGPGQGGIPGHNLPLFTAKYQALPDINIRPTTVRPPLVPTQIATYAGTNHNMFKITPMDEMQRKDGGIFRNIGVWQRARYFSEDLTCKAEIENVRNNVGMLDGSTLGKFRIHGPDALKALQRVYISDMSKCKEGRIKYTAMCNDDGCVIDDGVVIKVAENDYYFTTSTGRAGQTVEWIRYHTRYDNWDFALVNLTDAMGVINLSGPNARKVLEKVVDIDVSNAAFGFSQYKAFTIADTIPVKAMRLGFVGELSYELHVPSSYMMSLWCMLKEAGKEFGIMNFGVEAQNVLRMEKCHIILGQESEQRTNLLDVGLGFLWARKLTEWKKVGAVALRQAQGDDTRLTLVGIETEDNGRAARDGALIVDEKVRGYVATMRDSFSLKKGVGMALVEKHMAEIGTKLSIYEDECNGELIHAKVVPMPFYDPEGKRMKM